MKNPFLSPEARLAKFSEKYCKKANLADIPYPKLLEWREDTLATEGKHLAKHMSSKVWGDSAKSLITAASVIRTMVPELLASDENAVKLLGTLEVATRRRIKTDYEAKHGTFEEQLRRPKKGAAKRE